MTMAAPKKTSSTNEHSNKNNGYSAIIEAIPQPIITIGYDDKILLINTAAAELFGYAKDEVTDICIENLVSINLQAILENQHRVFGNTPKPLHLGKRENISITRKDGTELFVEVSISHFDEKDSFIILCISNINDRRLIELELTRSNEELNQFAYIASHDLKAPLRGIDNLATWIWEDIEDKDCVINHVQLMRLRIQRMQYLLDDLLEYSSVGQLDSNIELVDIPHLINDLYAQSTPPDTFSLQIACDIPPIETVATPLSIILRNLITNAIKYNDKENGTLSIRIDDLKDEILIAVEDNGPGIEEKFHQKIFGMFERLTSKDKIEGSGMGLAMVKKLVESFGGKIRIQSSKGQNTVFFITWIKKPTNLSFSSPIQKQSSL
ncbi:hypothetical protein A9Q99_14830 [Gammaproteobacteria bacterium 45_16_T64]|nr:hypothetical protein A9Q99_14830 [Gammaproteobacteria bacterium 45_16_T64]